MNNINVRLLIDLGEDKWKKLGSRRMNYIPRPNDRICIYDRDFDVLTVSWDLELSTGDEVVILMKEIKK